MKRIVLLVLCLLMLVPCFASCSKPPEYSEIEERFQELVAASGEINMIFFGEGLETYERISDPISTQKVIVEEQEKEDGSVEKITHSYYKLPDKNFEAIYYYRKYFWSNSKTEIVYLEVLSIPDNARTPFWSDEEKSQYAYVVEGYVYEKPEIYYSAADPEYYDYVRHDCKYTSIDEIKAAAEKVYSKDYLNSIYEMMFIGSVSDSEYIEDATARYIEYADDEGNISLMKANDSKVFITEIRQYDFSTAKIVKPANAEYVTIEIDSYLPSKPEDRLPVKLSMILQDGVWMLDAATY